jgi:predicted nucleic acid-binding protein
MKCCCPRWRTTNYVESFFASTHAVVSAAWTRLRREIRYVPVTTTTWRAAARLWAVQRKAGRVTAAEGGLDGDVLLAAQALAEGAVIVTPNTRHFEPMVQAVTWREL